MKTKPAYFFPVLLMTVILLSVVTSITLPQVAASTFGLTSTGSTSYPTAKTVTANGNAQVDTAQSKFGGASALFDGSGDYLSLNDSAGWYFNTGNFTIDFWVDFHALPAASQSMGFVSQGSIDTGRFWQFRVYYINGVGYLLRFSCDNDGGGFAVDADDTFSLSTETLYHLALVRSNNDWYFFKGGTQVGTTQTNSGAVPDLSTSLYVGMVGPSYSYLNASIDELRISNGIARWTSDFSASLPTVRYDRDSYTVLLLHNDLATGEVDGSTVFLDDVSTGQAFFYKFALIETGNPTSMSVYSHAAGNMVATIFTDSSGPSSKLCETADTAVSASAWTSPSISGCGSLSAADYWLGLQWNPGTAYAAGPSYTAGSANTGYRLYMAAYGAFPASGAGGTLTAEEYSVYVTYTTGVTITWAISGLSSDFTGTILTIDGSNYVYGDFPKSFSWAPSSTHNVTAVTPLVVTSNQKQYIFSNWTNGDGLSIASGTYTTPSSGITVTANYNTQYQITFTATSIESDANAVNVVTVGGTDYTLASLPQSAWYAVGASVTYAFYSSVVGTTYNYTWSSTSGLSQTTRTGSFAAATAGTVTGTYTGGPAIILDPYTYFNYVSGGGVNGTVEILDSIGLDSSVVLNSTGLYLDVTTMYPYLPSDQLRLQAWGTAGSGEIPIKVHTPSREPSVTNAGSSSYADGWVSLTTMNANTTITLDFDQWEVTITSSGIAGDSTGTVATLDSVAKTQAELPYSAWFDNGYSLAYTFSSPVSSTDSNKRYPWSSTSGLSQTLQTNSFSVSGTGTITGTYTVEWQVAFTSSGISTDTSGTVVTVAGVAKVQADLPFTAWYDDAATVTYSFASPVSATAGKRYAWASTSGLSQTLQTNTFGVTATGTVTGTYVIQYQVSFTSSGITGTTTTVVTVAGAAKTQSDLPFADWYDTGSSVTYAYATRVNGTDRSYWWSTTSGLSQTLQTNTFAVTATGTVTGTYQSLTPPANTCWTWASGAATGAVCVLDAITFPTAPLNTTTAMFFNVTGITTSLPSTRLQLQAWNTSNTGNIPITIQSGTVLSTYILNVASYSYLNPNITVSTLLSNQTVTANFGLLGGYGVKVYESTGTIPSAPTLASSVLSFTVTDSGAGVATSTHVYGTGGAPSSSSTLDGHTLPVGIIAYNAGTDDIRLLGTGLWILDFNAPTGGGGGQGSNPSVSTPISMNVLDPIPMLTVRIGESTQTELQLNVEAPWSYTIWSVTFDKNWVQATGLPLTYTPSIKNPTGVTSKPTIPIILNATHTPAPGDYLVNVGIQWAYGLHRTESSGRFHVRVLNAQGAQVSSNPLTTLLDWVGELSARDQLLLIGTSAAILILCAWSLIHRRREDHYWSP